MQRARDIELNFPIKDTASAALMLVKADCLYKAGIINKAEKRRVHSRARTFLDNAPPKLQAVASDVARVVVVKSGTRQKLALGLLRGRPGQPPRRL
jgi:hypothetical protein